MEARELDGYVCSGCGNWVRFYQSHDCSEVIIRRNEMADKVMYYPKYWSAKQPIPVEKALTRFQPVRHRAGRDGKQIGSLGPGAHVIVDEAEDDQGYVRIISVVGLSMIVPYAWEEQQENLVPSEREWWTDKTGLMAADSEVGDEVQLLVKRDALGHWSVTEL